MSHIERQPAQKRPFSDTVDFVKKRLQESRIGPSHPTVLEPNIPYSLSNVEFPEISKRPKVQAKYQNALALYLGTEILSLQEVGNMLGTHKNRGGIKSYHPLTKERVRVFVRESLKVLYETASPELRIEFPLKELSFNKPSFIGKRSRDIKAYRKNLYAIEDLVKSGSSFQDLKNAGFSARQIVRARETLRKRNGIKVPRKGNDIMEIISALKNPETPRLKVKEFLKNASIGMLYYRHEFTTCSEILKQAGIPFNKNCINAVTRLLEDKYDIGFTNIDFGARKGTQSRQVYRLTLPQFAGEIVRIVMEDQEIQEIIKLKEPKNKLSA